MMWIARRRKRNRRKPNLNILPTICIPSAKLSYEMPSTHSYIFFFMKRIHVAYRPRIHVCTNRRTVAKAEAEAMVNTKYIGIFVFSSAKVLPKKLN